MSLTINSLIVADARIQGVTLRPVLGAYELIFSLYVTVFPASDPNHRASIIGARVSAKLGASQGHSLGFARPEGPFDIRPRPCQTSMTPALTLTLQPSQIAALEELRGTGDIDFELLATGFGVDHNGEQQVQDTWRFPVPRSEWINKLRQAKARNILLIEVPLPLSTSDDDSLPAIHALRKAEEHFRNGDYHACVASCRTALQELGHQKYQSKDWSGPLLNRLASDRNGMTKEEREHAFWASLRHYTHQAHHAGSEGGVTIYSRSEAHLVLSLTASFVARMLSA